MNPPRNLPNILDYSDYRKFLADFYRERKAREPRFSYAFIARQVGFRAPSFFSHIVAGRTNISAAMTARFAAFLKFKRKESDYFEALVQYDQARSPEEKHRRLDKLASFRGSAVRLIERDRHEFCEKWYYIAIRESLYFKPFRGDHEELARGLTPPIKPAEARQAIALLTRLGMIRKDAQGRWVRADAVSESTGAGATPPSVDDFHRQTLALAAEAIDRFPRDQRSLSTLTLSLSPKGYKAIEEELAACRSRIRRLAEEDASENSVYHVNLSLFPFTQPPRVAEP